MLTITVEAFGFSYERIGPATFDPGRRRESPPPLRRGDRLARDAPGRERRDRPRPGLVSGCNTLDGWPSYSISICSTRRSRSRSTARAEHLFKHPSLEIGDIYDVWRSDPLFYPATPPAHWLMVSEVAGRVLVVPLAPPDSGDPSRCRPIGCYAAATHLAARYREDR